MRIKISLSSKTKTCLPSNNQHLINSYVHRCLGNNNEYHDGPSNYSVSSLQGGNINKTDKTLTLEDGDDVYFLVSSVDESFISRFYSGVTSNKIFYGDIRASITLMNEETYQNRYNRFKTLSPLLIKSNNKPVTIEDFSGKKEMSDFITSITKNRLTKISDKYNIGLDLTNFNIEIKWCKPTKKFVKPNSAGQWANECDFIVYSDGKTARTLASVGIGQSTGSGFGTICKIENYRTYRPKNDLKSEMGKTALELAQVRI